MPLCRLPDELLHQIFTLLAPPQKLEPQGFWDRDTTRNTLLSDNHRKPFDICGSEGRKIASRLSEVCQRLRQVFVPIIWAGFVCQTPVALEHLRHACREGNKPGAYIQDLQLSSASPADPVKLADLFEGIGSHLSSLRSLTLSLMKNQSFLTHVAAQVAAIKTLETLNLRIFGNSLGPDLPIFPRLQSLHLEIYVSISPFPTTLIRSDRRQRKRPHDWTSLFINIVDFVEKNIASGSLREVTWFIDWFMVHSFYRVLNQRAPVSSGVAPAGRWNVSRLSLTLSSQMGTQPFIESIRQLPLTDLALETYDFRLLNGIAFRAFCGAFPRLERLRLGVQAPSTTVEQDVEALPDGDINVNEFVAGIASLTRLKAYKGPVLFHRQTSVEARHALQSQVKASLQQLLSALRVAGVNPNTTFYWHIWLTGLYGPQQFTVLRDQKPKRLGS